MVRKFLYFIAFCIVAVIGAGIVWQMYSKEITEFAMVPSGDFVEQEPLAENAYEDPNLWYSRPGKGTSDPARWQPAYAEAGDVAGEPADDATPTGAATTSSAAASSRSEAGAEEEDVPNYAVFFVHPTSYLNRERWNAPMGSQADEESENIARIYVRGMASPFNSASEIWAPKYRQATMGAFLTDAPEGQQAIDAAYQDVREAYRYFVESIDEDTPIVLVGHSQGSLHLIRLLREEIKGSDAEDRIVASYTVGWPISVEHDLPEMGVAACATPSQTGCLLSWSSFAEPADPSDVIDTYAQSVGYDGQKRGDSTIVCTNPITGTFNGSARASENLGTLVPEDSITNGTLVPGQVPARCDARGILLIGDPPDLGSSAGAYVLPGNNYHVYDIPLFWANTQADVNRRVRAFARAQGDES